MAKIILNYLQKTTILLMICTFAVYYSLVSLADEANIVINPKVINPYKISELINGGFIEFLLDYVNGPVGL